MPVLLGKQYVDEARHVHRPDQWKLCRLDARRNESRKYELSIDPTNGSDVSWTCAIIKLECCDCCLIEVAVFLYEAVHAVQQSTLLRRLVMQEGGRTRQPLLEICAVSRYVWTNEQRVEGGALAGKFYEPMDVMAQVRVPVVL